jgi:beta-galactosidase
VHDIEFLKAAGYNLIRKHAKVENRRYYYHCDRLGMLVWQVKTPIFDRNEL